MWFCYAMSNYKFVSLFLKCRSTFIVRCIYFIHQHLCINCYTIYIHYHNTGIRCVCLSVCLFVCLSHLKSREWDVVVPCFLHRREELCLASCTNRFSSQYDAPLERKRLRNFFRGYALTAVYPDKNFQLQWAWSILPTKLYKVWRWGTRPSRVNIN